MDLEGIVAKLLEIASQSGSERRGSRLKTGVLQSVGREKLFDRERHREPVPGWHCCELACQELLELEGAQ
jgi:hypothetical protein